MSEREGTRESERKNEIVRMQERESEKDRENVEEQ
jgi:hypothetical protein